MSYSVGVEAVLLDDVDHSAFDSHDKYIIDIFWFGIVISFKLGFGRQKHLFIFHYWEKSVFEVGIEIHKNHWEAILSFLLANIYSKLIFYWRWEIVTTCAGKLIAQPAKVRFRWLSTKTKWVVRHWNHGWYKKYCWNLCSTKSTERPSKLRAFLTKIPLQRMSSPNPRRNPKKTDTNTGLQWWFRTRMWANICANLLFRCRTSCRRKRRNCSRGR